MTSPRSSIRVLCIDDHPVFRRGIALILDSQSDMALVGSVGNGERGVKLWRELRPDVTLMDLELPGIGGLEAIQTIRAEESDACIIVLTIHEEEEIIHAALQAGATTYLLKETLSHHLIRVIRQVHQGEVPVTTPKVAQLLALRASRSPLTPREVEVLTLMSRGHSNKEISISLSVTDDTVHKHVARIFDKLEVNNRTAAVTEALRRGLVHAERPG